MGSQKTKKSTNEEVLKEAKEQIKKIEEAKSKEVTAKDKKIEKKSTKKDVNKKPKIRSKKYKTIVEEFDKTKKYNLEEAMELVKKTSYSKFDGSVELHLNIIRKKNRNPIRKMVDLPHGNGKKISIIVLDEDKIAEIAKTKKINADIYIAKPELMPKIARIAKILGPKGKMPNPKSGTITSNPDETIKELSSGKIEIKEDKDSIIHLTIGKVSWDQAKLIENTQKILSQIPRTQLISAIISATMGPGVKIKL